MARDTTDATPMESRAQLIEWMEKGNKPRDKWRIGTEHEKFGYRTVDYSPIEYEGEDGIRALLEGMREKLGWEPILDDGRIIGLAEPSGNGASNSRPTSAKPKIRQST